MYHLFHHPNFSGRLPIERGIDICRYERSIMFQTGLQDGVGSGQMDMTKLFGTMQAAIGSIMPPPQPNTQPTVEEVKDVTPAPKQ